MYVIKSNILILIRNLIFGLCSILEYILTSTLLPILAIIRGLGLLILPPVNAGPRTTMSFPLLSACPFLLVAVHVYVPESTEKYKVLLFFLCYQWSMRLYS